MKENIICENGKCKDNNRLTCEEKFNTISEIIECEQLESMKPLMH